MTTAKQGGGPTTAWATGYPLMLRGSLPKILRILDAVIAAMDKQFDLLPSIPTRPAHTQRLPTAA